MTREEACVAHACPHCGRISAEEPSFKRVPRSHQIDGGKWAPLVPTKTGGQR